MEYRRSPSDMIREIVDLCDHGRPFASLLVLNAAGSTPGRTGARAIVHDDGTLSGTIGGGLVESEARRCALEAIATGRTQLLDFDMAGRIPAGSALICGGTMRVMVDPDAHRYRDTYAAAAECHARREAGVLLTSIQGPEPWYVTVQFFHESSMPAEIAFPRVEALRDVLQRDQPTLAIRDSVVGTERHEVLVEPLRPRPRLVIAGGGHVGQAVAIQADLVGFEVLVIDDRSEFTRPERFPEGVETRCGAIGDQLAGLPLGPDTYVVIVTRGHTCDGDALAACLAKPAAYIGMIGSHRKVAQMREAFHRSGQASLADFDRVYAPIGLDLGAVTVPEIATSIVAQLIAVRRKGIAARILPR